nr:DUF255 domain-containing protein [Streptomyces sp. SID7805]
MAGHGCKGCDADAASPCLQQHADNPVDWWSWSPEAFTEARERGVPVLLGTQSVPGRRGDRHAVAFPEYCVQTARMWRALPSAPNAGGGIRERVRLWSAVERFSVRGSARSCTRARDRCPERGPRRRSWGR